MTRTEALEAATAEARRVLGDAVDYRRKHPLVFCLVHARQATEARLEGRRAKAWYHRQWREFYKARALASEQADACASAIACLSD